jgi:hypothetical protein
MRNWILNKLGGISIEEANLLSKVKEHTSVSLCREQLGGVNIDTNFVDQMSENDKKEFMARIHIINTDKHLRKIIDDIIRRQVEMVVLKAETIDKVAFGRATINGVTLLKEEIEAISEQYINEFGIKEKFEVTDII